MRLHRPPATPAVVIESISTHVEACCRVLCPAATQQSASQAKKLKGG